MAKKGKDKKDDLDLGKEKKGSKLKLILIIVGALVLFAGGGAVTYFLVAPGEQTKGAAETEAKAKPEKAPAIYHEFKPAFVANLEGRPRLLQVGIQVRVRDPALDEFLSHNDPMIRHHILTLLSTQDGKALRSRKAKEKLQGELLKEMQKVVDENDGPGKVEALFFTSFVLQ